MPQPMTVSDATVLDAARQVLADKGAAFTLSDVAGRLCLSRAKLIQRFGEHDAILRKMARCQVDATTSWQGGTLALSRRDRRKHWLRGQILR
ncbi:TetR family transcriptional regulator [Rhodophyticola porphyridii]|uniref:TetR family transcriptional regulator n=1 Tax=Rhodophyticola porphyridii TaxID=1852017 RepID=A0A3L9XWL6_9RHOB|nr:TetR family transcriptional regulator [Rhodophyticola porphyridii]